MTGTYAAVGKNELIGCQLAVEQINAKGGILGRQVDLLVEDSTSGDAGTAVQKARKLIERDNVNFLLGNVNSALALAMADVSSEKGILHIVPGGHTDAVTGATCHWNVFRVCNTTQMEANAVTPSLIKNAGKKWYFITPDYAFGHTLQSGLEKAGTKFGYTKVGGDLTPLGTTDFSSYLIKAQAANPDVILFLAQGDDMVNALKQAVQFGLDKRFHLAGGQQELEPLEGSAARRANRHLGLRVVLESAERTARQGVRRRDHEEDRQGPDGTHLVRVRFDLELRAGRQRCQVARGGENGQGAVRHEVAAGSIADAGPGVLSRRPESAHSRTYSSATRRRREARRTICSRSPKWSRVSMPPERSKRPAAR